MKASQAFILSTVLGVVLCGACSLPQAAFGQGNLIPSGTPAPSMKSLDQIEPRTAITSAPYTISSPGSYFLTTNLNVTNGNAITISANRVTLDLNGFTLSSTQASPTGSGISLGSSMSDITILNGHITGGVSYSGGVYSGAGFAYGIIYSFPFIPENVRVAGVSVSGCLDDGINLGDRNSTVVESCTVQTVGGYGIVAASVSHSAAYQCGAGGIFADTASDCYGQSSNYIGLQATTANNCYGVCSNSNPALSASTANNCQGQNNANGDGLRADNAATGCYGQSNGSGVGVVYAGVIATGCSGQSASGTGLRAVNANNCYGISTGNGDGLSVNTANNCQGDSNGSGYGLYAFNAAHCTGDSVSGIGLHATDIAIGCFGGSSSSTGLSAVIANSCDGTSFNVTHKYNMP